MTQASDIEDIKTLEAWLKTRPREDWVVIAHRAALRVFPIWGAAMRTDWARKSVSTALPVLRCSLISAVAALVPTAVIRSVASAASAAFADAYAVARAAAAADADAAAPRAAADAAALAADAASAAYAAARAADADVAAYALIRDDAVALEKGADVMESSLWREDMPDWFVIGEAEMLELWRQEPRRWAFWGRWWDACVAGKPLDPQLQLAIVEGIDDETWQDPDAVAVRILEIEAEFAPTAKNRSKALDKAISETPNGERIEENPTTQKLNLVPEPEITDDLYAYASRKVLTTIEIVRRDRGQQYTALHVDLEMLEWAVNSDPSLPIELYDACQAALTRLNARCGNGELPDLKNDALLQDYRSRLRDAGADLFGNDPMTQNVIATRNKVLGNDVFVENAVDVKRAVEEIQPALEGTLADALPHNAEVATDARLDVEERKSDTYKLVSRVVRIAKIAAIGVGAVGGALIGTAGVIEAIPVIQASPHFQQLLELALRWLGLA